MIRTLTIAACFSALPVAHAQTPGSTNPFSEIVSDEELADSLKQPPPKGAVDPDDAVVAQFYNDLTRADRCPPMEAGRRRIPCAIVSEQDGKYRPVFRVMDQNTIWTFINGRLAQASIGNLAKARRFENNGGAGQLGTIIGFAENERTCKTKAPTCVPQSLFSGYVNERQELTPFCADQIWRPILSVPENSVVVTKCHFFIP